MPPNIDIYMTEDEINNGMYNSITQQAKRAGLLRDGHYAPELDTKVQHRPIVAPPMPAQYAERYEKEARKYDKEVRKSRKQQKVRCRGPKVKGRDTRRGGGRGGCVVM